MNIDSRPIHGRLAQLENLRQGKFSYEHMRSAEKYRKKTNIADGISATAQEIPYELIGRSGVILRKNMTRLEAFRKNKFLTGTGKSWKRAGY